MLYEILKSFSRTESANTMQFVSFPSYILYTDLPFIFTTLSNYCDRQICCALPNNNKSNPLINILKMPIKLNSLEKTAETQISRQESPINQYAVLFQNRTNQTL